MSKSEKKMWKKAKMPKGLLSFENYTLHIILVKQCVCEVLSYHRSHYPALECEFVRPLISMMLHISDSDTQSHMHISTQPKSAEKPLQFAI